MSTAKHDKLHELLTDLKLTYMAEHYRETLDEASRKNTSVLDVLLELMNGQVSERLSRALARRVRDAHLPKAKTLAEYDFDFPKRVAKQKVLRLFDCQFIEQFGCAVLIGPTGVGKTHLLTALGYVACEKGITVRFTRAINMINVLTTAQLNGCDAAVLVQSRVHVAGV